MAKNYRDEKRQKRIRAFVSFFIAFIMVTSIIGFMWGGDEDDGPTFEYNGFKMTRGANQFSLKLEDKIYDFDYAPYQVEDIEVGVGVIERLSSSKMFYMTFDPFQEDLTALDYVRFEIAPLLNDNFGIYASDAVLENNTIYTLPIITCSDATPFVPVMQFIENNETKIEMNGNCITATARKDIDYIMLKDRIIYGLLGVIE